MADSMSEDAGGMPEDLYPIAILIDELKHEDVQCRLNSMRRLDTIASALGPERTRNELLPFIAEGLDDDDEVLLVMAEQLGRFIPFVGGSDYAFTLLEPLETLATVEETTVRDKAILSLNVVLAALPPEHIAQYAWELLKRLGERDWFTSRTSACGLIARMCSRLPAKGANVGGHSDGKDDAMEDVDGPSRQEIFDFFQRLCSTDEVPMVRRSAAAALADIGTAMAGGALQVPSLTSPLLGANNHSDSKSDEGGAGSGLLGVDATSASESVPPAIPRAVTVNCASQDSGAYAAGQLLPLLRAFARDEQDGVRLLAVDGAVALLRLLNGGMRSGEGDAADVAAMLARFPDERQQVLAVVAALCTDRAWRVRWSVANRLSELADACGRSITVDHLLPRYGDLLIDAEAEVRTAAAYRVADVGRMVGRTVLLSVLVPLIHKLSEDQSEHVRAALSSVVLGVAPVLGTQATIESLLPLFLRLLKDTSPAVRLNIISKLEAVNAVIGLKMLSQSLLPAIQELSADKAWRVRQAIIEFTPLLAKQLGSDIFDSSPELTDLCMRWLTDPVFSVREAATGNLRKLAEVFGPAWADCVLIPRLLGLRADNGRTAYQLRMTVLQGMVTMGDAVGPQLLASRLLPAIAAQARDSVANVRFNVAKALQHLSSKVDAPVVASAIKPTLLMLSKDGDQDVRYFANKALEGM